MTSSNGNIFRVTGSLYREFIGRRRIILKKASDAEPWCLLWFASERWVNNRDAGDLRRHRAHYDVSVMVAKYCNIISCSLIILVFWTGRDSHATWSAVNKISQQLHTRWSVYWRTKFREFWVWEGSSLLCLIFLCLSVLPLKFLPFTC